jgi:uncharacterized protein (TIGR03067 family)
MRILVLLVLFLLVPVRPDPPPKEEVKLPSNQLLGTWNVTSVNVVGRPPPDDATGMTMVFTSNEIQIHKKGVRRTEDDAKYTIDWTKTPPTIDLVPRAEQKLEGLLKLEGDQLTMCIGIMGRPRDFNVGAAEAVIVIQLKRVMK